MASQLPEPVINTTASGFGLCLSLWVISVMLSGPSFSQGYVAIPFLSEGGWSRLTDKAQEAVKTHSCKKLPETYENHEAPLTNLSKGLK